MTRIRAWLAKWGPDLALLGISLVVLTSVAGAFVYMGSQDMDRGRFSLGLGSGLGVA
jgi:hypothetical protein